MQILLQRSALREYPAKNVYCVVISFIALLADCNVLHVIKKMNKINYIFFINKDKQTFDFVVQKGQIHVIV